MGGQQKGNVVDLPDVPRVDDRVDADRGTKSVEPGENRLLVDKAGNPSEPLIDGVGGAVQGDAHQIDNCGHRGGVDAVGYASSHETDRGPAKERRADGVQVNGQTQPVDLH